MTTTSLHRLGGKLVNDSRHAGLSERQEWLFDTVCEELGYRQRRRIQRDRCTCLLCCEPFADADGVAVERLEAMLDDERQRQSA